MAASLRDRERRIQAAIDKHRTYAADGLASYKAHSRLVSHFERDLRAVRTLMAQREEPAARSKSEPDGAPE